MLQPQRNAVMQQTARRHQTDLSVNTAGHGVTDGAATALDHRTSPDDLLRAATGVKYPYAFGKLSLAPLADSEVISGASLLESEGLSYVIDRYLATMPGADPRAVVSMWSMYYFSSLGIPAMLQWLELRRTLLLTLDNISISVSPATGLAQGFILPHSGNTKPDLTIERALATLVEEHAAPLIERIIADHRLGARVLWSNLASYLTWIVEEAGRLTDARLADEGIDFLESAVWASGMKNPMAGLNRKADDGQGGLCTRRRVCCLRYMLPGVAGCGMSCPLPSGRP